MATRQSDDPVCHLSDFQSGEMMTSSYIPTSQERIFELTKSGKNKACDLIAKKALATRCVKLQSKITKDVKLADPSRSTDIVQNTKSIFHQWKSKNKIKNMKNDGHAAVLVQLMDIVDIIDDHLKEAEGPARNTRKGNTRKGTLSEKQLFYQEILQLRVTVDHNIRTSLNDAGTGKDLLRGLKLEPQMIGRRFDPERVPSDPMLQRCIFCGHHSTITVKEDDGGAQRNDSRTQHYESLSKSWDAFKSARDVARNQGNTDPPFPLNPFNENREMRQAPNEPKKNQLETPRLLCTCVNNKNLNLHDVNSVNNGCIAKCRKRDKNDTRHAMVLASDESLEVYKWEVQPGQLRRSNCPSCLCICNKLYRIRDIQSIGLGLRQNNMRRVMGNGPTPETQLSQFLGQVMWAGKQAAIDIEAIQRKNGTRIDSNLRDEIYNDAVAEHVTRMSGNITGSIEMLQEKFGRKTRVNLPTGDR